MCRHLPHLQPRRQPRPRLLRLRKASSWPSTPGLRDTKYSTPDACRLPQWSLTVHFRPDHRSAAPGPRQDHNGDHARYNHGMADEPTKSTPPGPRSLITRWARWLGIGVAEEARGAEFKHLLEIAVTLGIVTFLWNWLVRQTKCLAALSYQITGIHATIVVSCLLVLAMVTVVCDMAACSD